MDGLHLDSWITNNAKVQESDGAWVDVDLWPMQGPVVDDLENVPNLLVLKARQLGLTWLCVFEIVWRMLDWKGLQVGVYSLREEEAVAVLQRVKDVYARVQPHWHVRGGPVTIDNNTHWKIANGSEVRAFSGRSGDSYTFGYVLIDEADLLEDLDRVLRSAEPTLSGGGCLRLVSRSNKTKPDSLFKRMYRAAILGETKWKAVFLPWWARPGRDKAWYSREKKTTLATRGNLDFVYEQYPATASEALAPSESDKRFPMAWVEQCLKPLPPLKTDLTIPNLEVYATPQEGRTYSIGGDPAEGNPTSDESAASVLDEKGRQAARLRGRLQPGQFAHALAQLSDYYLGASVLVERNNHGHAVLLALRELYPWVPVAWGLDGKEGWLASGLGNAQLYDNLAESLRDGQVTIRCPATADQLQTIQGADLAAPEGMADDLADAFALADRCRTLDSPMPSPTSVPNPRAAPAGSYPVPIDHTRPGHWDQGPAASPMPFDRSRPPHWG